MVNDKKFERILKAEMGSGYSLNGELDAAVRARITQTGRAKTCKTRVNWLAASLVCASLAMILLESLILFVIFGMVAACAVFILQASILNLSVSCCVLKRKIEEGEDVQCVRR